MYSTFYSSKKKYSFNHEKYIYFCMLFIKTNIFFVHLMPVELIEKYLLRIKLYTTEKPIQTWEKTGWNNKCIIFKIYKGNNLSPTTWRILLLNKCENSHY